MSLLGLLMSRVRDYMDFDHAHRMRTTPTFQVPVPAVPHPLSSGLLESPLPVCPYLARGEVTWTPTLEVPANRLRGVIFVVIKFLKDFVE